MAIYPTLEIEKIVQVNDRTRVSAVKSYADKSGDTINKVEIQLAAAGPWLDVTSTKESDWYTDAQYTTDGDHVITVRINNDTTPVLASKTITIISEADDALFATDGDLTAEEPDVLRYVRKGRNTFKDVHRQTQIELLDIINRKGYRTLAGDKITAADAVDKTEVRGMGKYMALYMIYYGLSNVVGDIFEQKAATYWSRYLTVSDRQIIGLDLNADGKVDNGEGVNMRVAKMVRG